MACSGAPAPGKEEGPSAQVGSGPSPLTQSQVSWGKAQREELVWRNRRIFVTLMIVITKATFCRNKWEDFSYYKVNFLSMEIIQERTQMNLCHPPSGDV